MKIQSEQVPQADNLSDVVHVLETVGAGAHTFQEIADGIRKVDRQGRYYRKAAEILGFIQKERNNYFVLTELGHQWVAANSTERDQIFVRATLNAQIFQRIIPFIEAHDNGVTREQLQAFLNEIADLGGESMSYRRTSTLIHWLTEIGAISQSGTRYSLCNLPDYVPFLDYSNNDGEPLMPIRYTLHDYQEHARRIRLRLGTQAVLVDQIKHERANSSHNELVKLVAKRVRDAGFVPKVGKLIDLAATIGRDKQFIFEMKSSTEDNVRSQIRHGLSQLYEYRYIEGIPNANLVLVIENKLPSSEAWMRNYLVEDRNVMIMWDGDGKLYCPNDTVSKLAFLAPVAV